MALELAKGGVEFVRSDGPFGNDESTRIDHWWKTYATTHPGMFDGPMLAIESYEVSLDIAVINWYRTTYSRYLWRQNPDSGQIPYAMALFVSALIVTKDSEIIVGRMGKQTSAHRRWQLPGGNVELGAGTSDLSLQDCVECALNEVREEVGIDVSVIPAKLWRIKHGGDFGDVGLIFKFETALDRDHLTAAFHDHRENLRARRIAPEFDALWVADAAEIIDCLRPDGAGLGPHETTVDYLLEVARELATNQRCLIGEESRDG